MLHRSGKIKKRNGSVLSRARAKPTSLDSKVVAVAAAAHSAVHCYSNIFVVVYGAAVAGHADRDEDE
jgi:hypothetical protein